MSRYPTHPQSRKAFETSLAFQPGDRCCDENPPESRNALLTKFRQQRISREDRILPVPEATGGRLDRSFIRFPGFHGRTKNAGGKTLENESFPARTLFMQSQAKAERNTGFPGRSGRSPVPLRSGGRKCGTLLTESLAEFTNAKKRRIQFPFAVRPRILISFTARPMQGVNRRSQGRPVSALEMPRRDPADRDGFPAAPAGLRRKIYFIALTSFPFFR